MKTLAKDYDFQAVTAEVICDAFINDLTSNILCQQLLENQTLDLKTAFDEAWALVVAHQSSTLYLQPLIQEVSAAMPSHSLQTSQFNEDDKVESVTAATSKFINL